MKNSSDIIGNRTRNLPACLIQLRHRLPPKIRLLISPLNAELNPICHLLALLGGATIVVVSRLRVKLNCKFPLKFQIYSDH